MKARRKRNLGVYVVFHRMAIGYRYMESFKTSGIIGYLHGQSTTKTQGPPKFFSCISFCRALFADHFGEKNSNFDR